MLAPDLFEIAEVYTARQKELARYPQHYVVGNRYEGLCFTLDTRDLGRPHKWRGIINYLWEHEYPFHEGDRITRWGGRLIEAIHNPRSNAPTSFMSNYFVCELASKIHHEKGKEMASSDV